MERADAVAPTAAGRFSLLVAVFACVAFPVFEIAAIGVGAAPGSLLPAVLVAACYFPLFVWIVLAALRGRRPRRGWWAVGGIALVLVVAEATVGAQSLGVFLALAVAAMLLVPPLWALGAYAVLAVATAPFALALDGSLDDYWYPTEVLWVYTLVAIVAAVRRLEHARHELADHTLLRERQRIDDELRATVGVALLDLAARGGRIAGLADTTRVEAELAELVEASRRAHAQARLIVRGYQRPDLRTELDSAVTLLAAAGVVARVVVDGDLPADSVQVHRDLEAATTWLLLDGNDGPVILRISGAGDAHRLTVLPDAGVPGRPVGNDKAQVSG